MREARIYNDRLYIIGVPQGISGFPKPAILAIASGRYYRRDRFRYSLAPTVGNLNGRTFRLEDGHLPDQQPRVTYDEACQWVTANPYALAYLTEP